MTSYQTFLQLHKNSTPFLLGNIWDVNSAKIYEASGYQAIGTSSLAVARANGYEDGEQLPFDTLFRLAKRVVEVVKIPFSVDIEGGYSRSVKVINEHIKKLHDAGVVGINLEDTIVGATRELQPVATFQKILSAVADHISRNNLEIFINVRTDAFLLDKPDPLSQTLSRINSYKGAGANGFFIPAINKRKDIKEVVKATELPINVLSVPGLPAYKELTSLGVKRISMGGFVFNKAYARVAELARKVQIEKDFSSILS